MNIYISNLDSNLKDQDLKDLFQPFGDVTSARIQTDVFTGASRGFGFVEMSEESGALKAIEDLHQSTVRGLIVSVSQMEPKATLKGSYKVGNGHMNIYKFRKN
jgi:RNA recognition motif-containing protein